TFKGPIHNSVVILPSTPAWSQGDPRKVIYPTDSRGQFCGQAGTPLEKKPLLFYFNILKCASPLTLLEFQCPTTQLCVESCPTKHMTLMNAYLNKGEQEYYKQFCKEGVDFSKMILRDGLCPSMLMSSKPFTRRCLPALSTMKGGVVVVGNETIFDNGEGKNVTAMDFLDSSVNVNVISCLSSSGLVIAMVVSLIFIVLLRYLAGIMIWVMIVMVILVIGYGIFHCAMEYRSLKGEPGSDVTIRDLGLQTDFSVYLQIRQTWLAFMIILSIVEVVVILLLIFLRKRVLIAIALIKEASRAVGHVMSSLFYPLLTFALLALVIAYWAITAVYPSAVNHVIYVYMSVKGKNANITEISPLFPQTFNTTNITAQCPGAECLFAFYGGETYYHKYLIMFQFYNVFLFFWCANFVTALGQVTLAGAFASYYWAFKKPDDIPANPICSSLGRALRYHTGSLAFGSLILSLVQVIRVLLEYLDQKLKAAQNRFAKFLLSCLKCCFWCLEKFIKFLNRNAYIMVAIYGKSFCTSARDAFFLLMRNIIRVAVLDKVTDFLLFLGKLLIVGIVGICSFFFFSGRIKAVEQTAPSLNYYWVPILTVVVGSYLIAHGFFSVYAMCVDTLFLCFCEDLERNDGSPERPYFMSPELHEILSKAKMEEEEDNKDGTEQPDVDPSEPTQMDEVRLEEEVPLKEQDGEIQLKRQDVFMQANEEEQPLKEKTEEAEVEEPQEEKSEGKEEKEEKGPEKKGPEEEERVEEKGSKEDKPEEKDHQPTEPKKQETEEKKPQEAEPKDPPSTPQE
uniref:Choline transporter-like protein n=1 Tax=Hucho hucho TaxID=62062 RepID=A0A4W5MML2_9TELE